MVPGIHIYMGAGLLAFLPSKDNDAHIHDDRRFPLWQCAGVESITSARPHNVSNSLELKEVFGRAYKFTRGVI